METVWTDISWSDILKAAPVATMICAIVFFGHWLTMRSRDDDDKK